MKKNNKLAFILSVLLSMILIVSSVGAAFALPETPAGGTGSNTENSAGSGDTGDTGDKSGTGQAGTDDQTGSGNEQGANAGTNKEEAEEAGNKTDDTVKEDPAKTKTQNLLGAPATRGDGDGNEDPQYTKEPVDLKFGGDDNKGYISGYEIYRQGPTDVDWSEVTDENPVTREDDVSFVLKFKLPARTLGTRDGDKTNKAYYMISIPGDNAKIKEGGGVLVDGSGNKAGTYEISSIDPHDDKGNCGRIDITFSEDYVSDNTGWHHGDNGSLTTGSVEFESSASSWDATTDIEKFQLSGDDEEISIIVVDPTVQGELKITKTAALTGTPGVLKYTMTVTSASGTYDDITIQDDMSGGIMIMGDGDFTVKKGLLPADYKSLKDKEGGEVSEGDTGFVMVLDKLGAGESYTITYDAYYPGLINVSRAVKNTAIATSTYKEETDPEPKHLISSSTCQTNLQDRPVSKRKEEIIEEGGHLYVDWTVTINPNGANVQGWMLKDKGQYRGTVNDHFLHARTVKLYRYEKGSTTAAETIDLSDVDLNGSNTIYTFPARSEEGGKNYCKYVLTYRTEIDFDHVDAHSADNIAILEHPKYEKVPGNSVGIGGLGDGEVKESDYVDLVKINGVWYAVIGWTVTVDPKYSSIKKDTLFTDQLGDGQTYRDPAKLKRDVAAAFTAKGVTGVTWIDGHDPEVTKTDYRFTINSALTKSTSTQDNKVEFSYESIFPIDDLRQSQNFDNKFSIPSVEKGGDSKAQYKPLMRKLGVMKDKSGRETRTSEDTSKYVGDGDLSMVWDVDVNLPHSYFTENSHETAPEPDFAVIDDDLPQGVVLESLTLTAAEIKDGNTVVKPAVNKTFENIAESSEDDPSVIILDAENNITASAWYVPPASEEKGGRIRILLDRKAFDWLGERTYRFRIKVRAADDVEWKYNDRNVKYYDFQNSATLSAKTGTAEEPLLSDSQMQTLTNDEHATAVIKKCTYNASTNLKEVPYQVVVNREGKNLLENSDTIEFIDTLTPTYPNDSITVSLHPESFRVYKYDPDKEEKGEDITDSIVFEHEPGHNSGDSWVIKCELPDDTPLLVEYTYHISGFTSGREQLKLKNSSSIYGVATISNNGTDNEDLQLLSKGTVETHRITFHKVDEHNNTIPLDGAVFDAYIYNKDTEQYEFLATLPPSHVEKEDGKEVHGEIVFNQGNLDGHELKQNTAYRLVEKTPPPGYRLDKTPVDFVIPGNLDEHPWCAPEDFDGYRIGFEGRMILKNEAYTPLQITKVNKSGKPLKGAVFDLYEADPESDKLIPFTSVKGNLISEGNETDSKGQIIFPNWVDPGDYYLIETTAPGGGYLAWDEAIHFRYDGHVTFLFDNKFYITQKKSPGGLAPYEVEITDYVPEVKVEKEASSETARRGDVITYTVRVKNTGKVNVYDYLITDTPVAGIEYVSDDSGGTFKDGAVTWRRDIRSGETVTIHVKARVTEHAGFITVNNVTVTGGDIAKAYVRVVKSGANTGDSSRTVLWAALLIAAAAGCIIMIVRRRRNS